MSPSRPADDPDLLLALSPALTHDVHHATGSCREDGAGPSSTAEGAEPGHSRRQVEVERQEQPHLVGSNAEALGEVFRGTASGSDDTQDARPADLLQLTDQLSLDPTPSTLTCATDVPTEAPPPTSLEPPKAPDRPLTPPKDEKYLDPTPKTPLASRPPSRSQSVVASTIDEGGDAKWMESQRPHVAVGASNDIKLVDLQAQEAPAASEAESKSEIQSIMDQFDDDEVAPKEEEVMSPRLELAGPLLGAPLLHPPRQSSLEPLRTKAMSPTASEASGVVLSHNAEVFSTSPTDDTPPPPPPKDKQRVTSTSPRPSGSAAAGRNFSPSSVNAAFPEPDPEPDLPFDFHRFLEQLRHRTADPVAKFLRSFLSEFGKKQWMVHEQVKIISDFLAFITDKMAQCEIWRGVSDAEFDNAREGMEKLVMNRLYSQTFSPAIPPPPASPVTKGKRRQSERNLGPGRRGQHQEDVERDDVLAQKVRIYGWVREEHLDIKPVGDSGRRFLSLAQQELLKIKTYRAPRDKVICVLNCCKVIFGLLRNSKSDQSADSFVPLLIYVVLQANPDHLVSNVQYIMRFRNQDKLGGEAGYYLSSLMGAIQFIENLDRTSLTISAEDFEKHVEAAVSTIAEKHPNAEDAAPTAAPHPPIISEKSSISRPEVNARNSMDGEYSSPRRTTSPGRSSDLVLGVEDEKAAVAGLLRTIQRPLSTIGRMFSDDNGSAQAQRPSTLAPPSSSAFPISTPQAGRSPGLSPGGDQADGTAALRTRSPAAEGAHPLRAEDAAARQASAETAEAQRIQSAEHADVVETLSGMFPDLDKDVIDDVVRMKEGRVGLAVDACLALST